MILSTNRITKQRPSTAESENGQQAGQKCGAADTPRLCLVCTCQPSHSEPTHCRGFFEDHDVHKIHHHRGQTCYKRARLGSRRSHIQAFSWVFLPPFHPRPKPYLNIHSPSSPLQDAAEHATVGGRVMTSGRYTHRLFVGVSGTDTPSVRVLLWTLNNEVPHKNSHAPHLITTTEGEMGSRRASSIAWEMHPDSPKNGSPAAKLSVRTLPSTLQSLCSPQKSTRHHPNPKQQGAKRAARGPVVTSAR